MSERKELPAQSMDMELARPDRRGSLCPTCRFRKDDSIIRRGDGSVLVIEQWDNMQCKKYEYKPVGVVFDNQDCVFYERDQG